MLPYQNSDFGNITLAVDIRPNKAAHFVKVNITNFRLFEKLLRNFIENTLIFDFKGYDTVFIYRKAFNFIRL